MPSRLRLAALLLLALASCARTCPLARCPSAAVATAETAPPPTAAPTAPTASGYDRPPPHIAEVLRAPSPPQAIVSPARDAVLLVWWAQYPPIAQVAEPFLKLAGVRVEPRTRRKRDTPAGYGIAPCARAMSLVDVATGRETPIAPADPATGRPAPIAPADPATGGAAPHPMWAAGCADNPMWTADGRRLAFRYVTADAVELWVADAATGAARRIPGVRLNPMLGSSVQWLADQRTLLVKLVPADIGPPPVASATAVGPSIQETDGRSGESSTYEVRDTLASRHDEDLFAYYGTSQLAAVDAATGAIAPIGAPAVLAEVDAAPDGQHLLVTSLRRPYSYATTCDRFAHDVEVWDRSGRATPLARLPVADRVPINGVPTGPREHQWRPTEPATLVWAEALDGGDWNVAVPARDKVMLQRAPFAAPAVEIARTAQRFAGLEWSERPAVALLHEYDDNRHWQRTFVVDVDRPATPPRLLWDLSSDERYLDPGQPVYRVLPNGQWVVQQDGDAIFVRGQGASPAGDRPFLDRLDLATGKSERLFRSELTAYEYFLAFTDPRGRAFLTWHQSPTDPPNAMLRALGARLGSAPPGEAAFASAARAVTRIPDPTPAVRQIEKRLVTYRRKDGVELSFTLYTPPGYQAGTRLPAILYAYPLDYASAATAGQVSGSEQLFTRLSGHRLLLLAGYAIIDNASFPIVGDPRTAYDTYLQQLIDDARAAVDQAVALGVVDRDRIGVTGHSHGALMAVNLLAHTDLFRAGVATSGAYNKTLTPFGFQSERRSVWKARDVYLAASPLFVAHRIARPLLLVHGQDDANPGTTPLQSVKLFEAIRGNGGTARLVMLPHEPHWYAALESNEQLAFEELTWFDRYVKNAPPPPQPASSASARSSNRR